MSRHILYNSQEIFDKLADTGMLGRSMADQYRMEHDLLENILRNEFIEKYVFFLEDIKKYSEDDFINYLCRHYFKDSTFNDVKKLFGKE